MTRRRARLHWTWALVIAPVVLLVAFIIVRLVLDT